MQVCDTILLRCALLTCPAMPHCLTTHACNSVDRHRDNLDVFERLVPLVRARRLDLVDHLVPGCRDAKDSEASSFQARQQLTPSLPTDLRPGKAGV